MPRTITRTVYEYDELSDQAKGKARDWYCEGLENEDYAEYVIEDAQRMGAILGIEIGLYAVPLMSGKTRDVPNVSWSLHVQGAGVTFKGRYAYKAGSYAAIKKEAPEDTGLHGIAVSLMRLQQAHGYRRQLTATIAENNYDGMLTTTYVGDDEADEATSEAVAEAMRDFARWIYDGLNREYDYRTSDEAVAESILANEYTFDANGRRDG